MKYEVLKNRLSGKGVNCFLLDFWKTEKKNYFFLKTTMRLIQRTEIIKQSIGIRCIERVVS